MTVVVVVVVVVVGRYIDKMVFIVTSHAWQPYRLNWALITIFIQHYTLSLININIQYIYKKFSQ